MSNNCIFSDKEIKESVHKSLIENAGYQARQLEVLESLKTYTKELNDNAMLHSNHLEKIEKSLRIFTKYFLPAFAIVLIVAFIAVGGGTAIEKAVQIFLRLK